ncbi:MAG: MBL fold metallo-hydrolase [Chitinivibrionales bacterium]|nr:MBL fold metallo-hydrolase [Chitinivibrionales bacterium]MBD3357053.1 MBL fold metallo-hydrolase [Chitinivibrionales bacterium]
MITKDLSGIILIDDHAGEQGLHTEHGLSLWIEAAGKRILFDTGQSDACVQNAEKLGIDVGTADLLVLSHGHYDHTGGVEEILRRNPHIAVYCHPGIFVPRYSRQENASMKPVSIDRAASNALHKVMDTIGWVSKPMNIASKIGITGPIPRKTAYEDTGGAFFLDPGGKRADLIEDDLAVWIETNEGLVIITGCCHAGLVNTLQYVRGITNNTPIHAIVGGFHLVHASPTRLQSTVNSLRIIGFERIMPCHCTGDSGVQALVESFGPKVMPGSSGADFSV